ncbi:MAG TPA: PAS domain-containing protein, partial [Dissulfurispiraceae bacterium]
MESLFGLISHHLDVVFFVYGLSFVALGLAITFQPKRGSVLKLADHLWLLAGFGLAHGSNEWAEMWIMIKGGNETLVAAQQLNLFISFLFLFEFGRRLMSVSAGAVPSKLSRFLAWQLTPLAALAAAAFSLTSHAFEASIWIRYILCLPGAVMTGTGFLLFCSRERETIKALRSERYFRYAGTFFLLYGFFSGMVGPKGDFFPANVLNFDSFFRVTHLPVQVFRACAAVVITWAVLRMLGIFDRELKERIQKTLSFEKESRELIERLSRRNELILNAAGEGICGVDASGRITFANPSAAFMFRCRVEELTGMALAAVAQKSASGGVSRLTQDHPIVKTITSGVAQHVTGEVFMRKDGTSFTADYISTPIMEHNEFVGAVVVFRDITRDIEAEEERGKLEVQLRQ